MSRWVYINGVVQVDTIGGLCQANNDYEVNFVVETLPQITGSEKPANLYVVRESGHNISSNVDQWDRNSNLGKGSYGGFEAQTTYNIVISGALRDRSLDVTLRETVKMLNRLSKRLSVDSCIIQIKDCLIDKPVLISEYIGTHGWMFDNYEIKKEEK